MSRFIVVDIATGRQIGGILTTTLHSAKCLSPRLFGWGRFNRVFPAIEYTRPTITGAYQQATANRCIREN